MNIPPSHPLKERIEDDIGDQVIDNEDSVNLILQTLESVYGSDEVMEVYLRFRDLETKQRTVGQDVVDYLNEWETRISGSKTRALSCRKT